MKSLLKSQEFVLWTVVAKLSIIVQMLTISSLGLFADNSLTAAIANNTRGATFIFLFQFVMAIFLIIDLMMTDHSSYQRRSWRLEYYTPTTYMLAGGSFLSVALISSASGWSLVLVINYFFCTALAGAIALLLQLKRVWKALGQLEALRNDL